MVICRVNLANSKCIKWIIWVFLKWDCMRYLSIVSVLSTVDDGRHAPSLEKQTGVPRREQSNVLLWTGAAAKAV